MSDFHKTPLDVAIQLKRTELADLLRKHGGKTGEELKAEGKWNTYNPPHLKLCEIHWEKGETVGFAPSQITIHCSLEYAEGSIPAIHSEPQPVSLNGLPFR